MNALEAARIYVSRGWRVVPIEHGAKRPPASLTGWQTLRIAPEELPDYFRDGLGVGLLLGEPSGGLVDVDLDCEEAVTLAPHLLPDTPVWSGHARRPRSHAWYLAHPAPDTHRFRDLDDAKATLVELRSTGAQTVVAPSLHPDGGPYRWVVRGARPAPARVEGPALVTAVRRLAAATVLARHWPRARGSRHDIANALAGMLGRAGWKAETAAHFIRLVAHAAGDEEAGDREQTARATVRALASGKRVTGAPTLAGLVGEAIVAKVREWLRVPPTVSLPSSPMIPMAQPAPWPPLADAAYHGLAGDFVRLVEPHTEADPAAVLLQFLVMFGNVIGRGPHAVVEADRHYTNLFVAIVGATSKGRKGVSHGQARRPFQGVDETWATERIQGGLSSGEGLIWAVRDAIEKSEPVKEKGRVVDYQPVIADAGVSDKRLLVVEPELASTLRVMGRDGSILSAVIRQAWDTGDLRVLTKNTPAKATGAHISIIGHVTKLEVLRYLDATEKGNGFANRFLWVCARRSKTLSRGGRVHTIDFGPFVSRLSAVVRATRDLGATTMTWDEEAGALWDAVYGPLSEGGTGMAAEVTSRAEAQVLRLALIYAVLDQAQAIGRAHLEAALAVWRYCEAAVQHIFADGLGDPLTDEILAALRQAGATGLTRTDLRERFQRNRRSEEMTRALGLLHERGLARFEREATGEAGRPAERWYAVGAEAGDAINAKNAVIPADDRNYRVNGVYGVRETTAAEPVEVDESARVRFYD